MKYPKLYEPGQKGNLFNRKEFLFSVMHGIISSLVLFFIPYGTMFQSVNADGKDAADIQSFGFAVATILVIVVNLQVNINFALDYITFMISNLLLFQVWSRHVLLDGLQSLLHMGHANCTFRFSFCAIQ